MARPRYKEEDTIRAFMKKRALRKGKRTRDGKPVQAVAPYMYFFHCLEDQERSLRKILSIIKSSEKSKISAAEAYAAKPKMSTDFAEIADEMRLESEAIEHESAQEIFAGTLFVMFNSLLMSLVTRVKVRGGKSVPLVAGRKIGKTTFLNSFVPLRITFGTMKNGISRKKATIKWRGILQFSKPQESKDRGIETFAPRFLS